MSGLDGLGWPDPEDVPKPKKIMNTPTPETDAENERIMKSWNTYACDYSEMFELAQKLERERDDLREQLTAQRALANRLARCLVICSWDHPKADECQSAYEAWEEARK
jgi:hypothetical protein